MRRGDVDDVDVGIVGEVAVRGVGTNRRRRAGILLRANACADSGEREPTATSTLSGTSARSLAKLWAILPVARMPQRTGDDDTDDT